MPRPIKKGDTDVSVVIRIIDSTDGTPETGVVWNTSGIDMEYRREGAAVVDITEATLAALTTAHADGGFLHIGNGYYRLDVPDAAFATGADGVLIQGTVTGMVVIGCYIPLVDYDPYDGVRMGMTALPNAAADAAGGLVISDAGGQDIDAAFVSANRLTAARAQVLDDWINAGRLDLLLDAIKAVTDAQAATGTGLSAIPWNASWDAEVQSEVNDALVALGLDHLVNVAVTGTDVTNNSIIAQLVSASATADWDDFVNTTDALQAIRDRGDSAWITGGGGGITDILNVSFLVPSDIDLANTATFRLGMALINSLDDLPTTAEIDPGTISIERKAIGGTSWSAVVTDAACSEAAGLVYYDEVFDAGTGYAEGDSIRVTFKAQKITVAANDYEISDATGRMFYTSVRQTMRGTNSANTTTPPTAVAIRTEIDSNSTQLATIVTDTNELQTDDVPGLIAALNNLSAAAVNAEVDTALSDFFTSAAQLVDDIWNEVISKAAHDVAGSAAKILRQSGDITQIDGAVSDVSPSVTGFDTNLTQVDGYFDDSVLVFGNGSANAGIGRPVVTYLNVNGAVTFTAPDDWPVTPVNGDDFVIYATHVHPVAQIRDAILADSTPFNGADIAAILTDTGTSIPATLTTIDAVVDSILAMLDDPRAEPGQGAPAVNADLATKIDYLYKAFRNKSTQTATTHSIFNDAGDTVDHKSTDSDDTTTATKGEIVSGP